MAVHSSIVGVLQPLLSLGVFVLVSKICPWDGGVCHRDSCDSLLPSGQVVICKFHGNKLGRLTPHKVAPVHRLVFSKHFRGGKR